MLELFNFPLFKLSATGNDFLLVDLRDRPLDIFRSEFTRRWCDRHTGLGADGMVFIEAAPQDDFAWDFYNSDGGSAEMCGNAARAVSLYIHLTQNKNTLTFQSKVGRVQAKIHSPTDIEVGLPAIKESQWAQTAAGQTFTFVRAGVPHAVIQVDAIERKRLQDIALQIKSQPRFKDEGVNVTFIKPVGANALESITFERGVEDFTLSCGTGAIAAAHTILRGEENRRITVQVPGGTLSVVWKEGQPWLRGTAQVVAEMRLVQEAK